MLPKSSVNGYQPGTYIEEAARAARESKPSKIKTFNEQRGLWNEPYNATTYCGYCGVELRVKPEARPFRCTCRATLLPCHVCDRTKKNCPKRHGKKCLYSGMEPYEAVSIVRYK